MGAKLKHRVIASISLAAASALGVALGAGWRTASADDLRNIITNGKGHMPKCASKLTPEEIDTLVQQIKALNKK